MARFDELPADQQAVLRLLLTQDTSYDEIARTLRMAPAAVRDRAYDALGSLGPAGSAPDHAGRAAIGDYLLRQRDDAPSDLTTDAGARSWATGVRKELVGVATGPIPELPGGAKPKAASSGKASTAAAGAPKGSRVGGAILLTGAGILAALLIGVFVGRATKSDSSASKTTTTRSSRPGNVIGQANLRPTRNANAPRALGIAQFARQGGKDRINVIAEGLPKIPKNIGYGVWLIDQKLAPVFLGYFQALTTTGQAASQSDLKVDPRKYSAVAITKQRGKNPTTPGEPVIGGQIQFPTS